MTKRKFKATTDPAHTYQVAENHLNCNFTPEKSNLSWMAYITYIWTVEGWLYLATIMDLYSRNIIVWSLRDRLINELGIAALYRALRKRKLSAD